LIIYFETSAAAKLLIEEAESAAMATFLDGFAEENHVIASSVLLETELRRTALRARLPQASATAVLDRLDLIELDRATFAAAAIFPDPNLRSLDALHLAAAMRVGADLFISYDERKIQSAIDLGLHVVSPTA
jgi:predicted nucleic acid-binding protein